MALPPKQQAFVKEYIKDKNATRAYRAAGYTGKGAAQSASALLTNPKIKQAVESGLRKLADRMDISAERTIKRIADIAYHAKKAKNSDVLKACELLGKHFKLFTDVQEVSGKDGGPQVVAYVPHNGRPIPEPEKTE